MSGGQMAAMAHKPFFAGIILAKTAVRQSERDIFKLPWHSVLTCLLIQQ